MCDLVSAVDPPGSNSAAGQSPAESLRNLARSDHTKPAPDSAFPQVRGRFVATTISDVVIVTDPPTLTCANAGPAGAGYALGTLAAALYCRFQGSQVPGVRALLQGRLDERGREMAVVSAAQRLVALREMVKACPSEAGPVMHCTSRCTGLPNAEVRDASRFGSHIGDSASELWADGRVGGGGWPGDFGR